MSNVRKALRSAIVDPKRAWRTAVAIVRGSLCVAWYRLRGKARIAFPFLVFERVRIAGPGRVAIGPRCVVHPNAFRGLSIVTLDRAARVTIGSDCNLGGLAIRCRESVIVGDRMMSARSLIQDTDFCAPTEHDRGASQIVIAGNAWLGGESLVLGGSHVGADAVLGWNACCDGHTVPEFHLVTGNPVVRPVPIPKLLDLTGTS